ncbi:MAG TPA: hydroxypyruvate isomerase, partial [Bryobacteraceae bacterium]|nr:hydroxypyruvate isomerase [Bryobacteraceae bacterium]
MRRRDFVTGFAAVGAAGIAVSELRAQSESSGKVKQGRIRQCLTRGVFGRKSGMSFDDICRTAAELGVHGFDLIPSRDWPTLKKYGLKPTMAPPNRGVTIPNGINDRSKHDELVKTMLPAIDECAAGGCPNLITVS